MNSSLYDVGNHALIDVNLLYALDPDEVIYDDVPRENSDSNTGLQFSFYSLNMLLPVCSLPLLLHFYYPLYSVKTYIVFFFKTSVCAAYYYCVYLHLLDKLFYKP